MNLKTYSAGTMAQALSEVKKDLGKDAVILHTRVYKTGAVMGVGGRQVVEITASDEAAPPRVRAREHARPAPDHFEPSRFSPLSAQGQVEAKPMEPAAPPAEPAPVEPRRALTPAPRPARSLAVKATFKPVDAGSTAELHSELASIKRLIGQVLRTTRSGGPNSLGTSDPLINVYIRLHEAGVSDPIADSIIGHIRGSLTRAEQDDESVTESAVLRCLAEEFVVADTGPIPRREPGGRPRVIALVGPTGVGKTTTIAKIAAAYKLRQSRRVGLVTADTYRIAAVEQLRTYANIIGLPLRVALTPREVTEACEFLGDCDVILLDTAGRSQHDGPRLDELAGFVEAASPDETHLVLSAAMAESVLLQAAERFKRLSPDRLVLSKLDEAVQLGTLVNAACGVGLPLSYVTTGQEVPDQIEAANRDRLARLVFTDVRLGVEQPVES